MNHRVISQMLRHLAIRFDLIERLHFLSPDSLLVLVDLDEAVTSSCAVFSLSAAAAAAAVGPLLLAAGLALLLALLFLFGRRHDLGQSRGSEVDEL